MLESSARKLLVQVLGAVTIAKSTSNLASPLDFGKAQWMLVANAVWASLVPVALRYVNKKDAAFGLTK